MKPFATFEPKFCEDIYETSRYNEIIYIDML